MTELLESFQETEILGEDFNMFNLEHTEQNILSKEAGAVASTKSFFFRITS